MDEKTGVRSRLRFCLFGRRDDSKIGRNSVFTHRVACDGRLCAGFSEFERGELHSPGGPATKNDGSSLAPASSIAAEYCDSLTSQKSAISLVG